jgi:FKBP-type peptidyl-prolyl cis-trans isomerase FklB
MSDAKAKGAKFLAENAKKPGIVSRPSGLQYKIIVDGKGASPSRTSLVTTHYAGTLIDGTEFDSSYARNEPATFGVNQVIAGWTEALQLMKVGSKWELYIPSNLAYGPRGAGGDIGPDETLIFTVELLKVQG